MTTDHRRKSTAAPSPVESGVPEQPLVFEEALGQLDAAVAALEGGQIPLDDALAIYEQGVRMARHCHELLDAAQLRVQRLSQREDGFALEPFEPDGE